MLVASLIAPFLEKKHVAAVPGVETVWLAENQACDVILAKDAGDIETIRQYLGDYFKDMAVDILVQPLATRRKRVLLADMESTLIEQEMLDELADKIGLHARIAAITAAAMRGELDFIEALTERVRLLKDVPLSTLVEAAEKMTLMPGAATLVATLRHHGIDTLIVSGGFNFFTGLVAKRLGCAGHMGNMLGWQGERLDGTVLSPILDKHAKREALLAACSARGIATEMAAAVGDGANDIPMLLEAGLGVAYRAKPNVQKEATFRVNHGDLTAILYAMGFARNAFMPP